MDDVHDNGLGWDEPLDRRKLLGKAAIAGGAIAAGGLLASSQAGMSVVTRRMLACGRARRTLACHSCHSAP